MSTQTATPRRRNVKRLGVLGAVLLALAGAGVAFAAYLSSGSGTGATTASNAQNSVITSASTGTALYPGGSTTYKVTINNPNPYPVTVTSISAASSTATGTNNACVAGTVTSPAVTNPNPYPVKVTSISAASSNATGASNACVAGTVTSPAVTSPAGTIAANSTGTYGLVATMISNPDNSCQGVSFTMPLTAQLASAA